MVSDWQGIKLVWIFYLYTLLVIYKMHSMNHQDIHGYGVFHCRVWILPFPKVIIAIQLIFCCHIGFNIWKECG